MADIFREVDEDVRTDRLATAWAKYSILVYGGAAAIVIATAIYSYLHFKQTEAANAAGAIYETAQALARANKPAEASIAFAALAADAPQGYRLLASLRAAEEKSLTDKAGAVKDLDALAADARTPPLFQETARLRAGFLRVDEADKAELEQRFGPLLNGAFRFSAREMLALAALKRGDAEEAGRQLDRIVIDPNAPAAIRQRAEALQALARGAGRFAPSAPAPAPSAPPPSQK